MSDREPKLVSVIIPCYNYAHFLGEAIESVLCQTDSRYEVIVIDDGSTDSSSEVATNYPQVRGIRQENRGLSESRNRGIRESRGTYLVFLDADDRLLPTALEIGVNALEANPECAFAYGRCQRINFDGNFMPSNYETVSEDHYVALLHRNHIWMPAQVMYRRSIFQQVSGFNPAISAAADYDLYMRVCREFPVVNHNQIIAEYRQHQGNMSNNNGLMLKNTVTALRSQRKLIRRDKHLLQVYREGMKHWRCFYGEEYVDEIRVRLRQPGRRWQVMKDVMILARYYPTSIGKHLYKKAKVTIRWILGVRSSSIKPQAEE